MRSLHVAALPFPSPQGTQALIDAMLRALHDAGHEAHLLCYAHGASSAPAVPYTVHRAKDLVRNRSLASGPSLAKVVEDVALTCALSALVQRVQPEIVVAHHVEAALAVRALGIRSWLFVAHTSLSAELPEYFPKPLRRTLRVAGRALDRRLCRSAPCAVAVSPSLASRLSAESAALVEPIALPWSMPNAVTSELRRAARRELALSDDAQVALYAGNLDAYQGLAPLAEGLSRWLFAQPNRTLLVATHDSRERLLQSPLGALRLRSIQLPLHDEAARVLAHAAADVALVPRKSPGGIPIKLVDALARGLPVLATRRATCGLALGNGCRVLADDEPHAWHLELDRFFAEPAWVRAVCARSASEVASQMFARERFVQAFLAAAASVSEPFGSVADNDV